MVRAALGAQQRLELPAVAIRLLTGVGAGRSPLKGFVYG
jgi:hypothetical protein